jgi:uncharacterized protein (TIGR03437 family)
MASLAGPLLVVAALIPPLRADSGVLTLSQGVAPGGGRVVLDLSFTSTGTPQTQPAGLEWALAFNAQSVGNISVAPAAGAIAAGKSIECYQANGTYSCLATGLNSNAIMSGSIAKLTVTLAPGYEGLVSFGVTNTEGVTGNGTAVPISGKGATLVVYGLTSLACSPTTLPSASSTNCTVKMSPAAPSGGAKISLASNSPALVVPTAVIMPAGSTTAIFSAHTGHISAKRSTATVTASYAGTSQSTPISLSSARSQPRMVNCSPPAVAAGSSTTCTLSLSADDEPGEFTLSGGPNLRLPPVIRSRPGQGVVRFQVSAGALSPRQTANITVQDETFSITRTIEVLPSSAPVLTLPGRRFARIGLALEFTVAASDPSGLPSILIAGEIPKGASFDSASGRFAWTPDPSQAGQFDIPFTVTNSAAASATGHVLIEVGSGRPLINGIRNGASQEPAGCSPSAVATLAGSWLSASEQSDSGRGSRQLAGARVIVNHEAAPVLAVSPERIDFLCPGGEPGTRLSISVENEGGSAAAIEAVMQPPTPGIFARDRSGRGQGLVIFSGTSLLAASRTFEAIGQPAQAGDVLTILATGIDPDSAPPLVRIGEIVVGARSVAAMPGQAGVFGVEIPVPPGVPEGDAVPLTILPSAPGSAASNTVTIAIE